MKKKILSITILLLIVGAIGIVLANNKAKIDKAANPVKFQPVIPVKVHEVKLDSFNISFTLNGTTSPAKEVELASEVQGKLTSLFIKNGDVVRAGQVIAALDASVYSAQLNSVNSSVAKTELDIARYTKLIEMGGASASQLETIMLQRESLLAQRKDVVQQMSHMQIRAPFSGKVENVMVETGSFVTFGTVLAQLIDNSSLKIKVYLSEQEAFRVEQSQEVEILTAALPEPKKGKVHMVSEKADATGKFLAEIIFTNSGSEKLKAGMLADIKFPIQSAETGLSVPISALTGSGSDAKVYIVRGSRVASRMIKTGIITSTKVQVLHGLNESDKVVVSGQLNLEDGTPVFVNN